MIPVSFHTPSRSGPRHWGQSAEINTDENTEIERNASEAQHWDIEAKFMVPQIY